MVKDLHESTQKHELRTHANKAMILFDPMQFQQATYINTISHAHQFVFVIFLLSYFIFLHNLADVELKTENTSAVYSEHL